MAKDQKYSLKPTHIPGVELRVLKGTDPKVPEGVVELLLKKARPYAQTDMQIKELEEIQETEKPGIVDFVEAMPGLRGIRSVPEDWDLLAVEKQASPEYNGILLKTSLGATLFPEIVGEELVVTITIPPNTIDEGDVSRCLNTLFKEKGIPHEDIPKLFKIKRQPRVDEEKLDQLIEERRVIILPGTIKEATPTWSLKVDVVRKKAKELKKLKNKK